MGLLGLRLAVVCVPISAKRKLDDTLKCKALETHLELKSAVKSAKETHNVSSVELQNVLLLVPAYSSSFLTLKMKRAH